MNSPKGLVKPIISFLSKLFKSNFFNNYKQYIAVTMVFVLFLAAGMIIKTSAVSPEDGQVSNLVTAYRVTLNGNEIGYVTSQNHVSQLIEEIRQNSIKNYGMDVYIEADSAFYQVSINPAQVTKAEALKESVYENITVRVKGYVLTANGEELGILRTEGEAQKVLDKVKAPFISGENSTYEEVTFLEEVNINPTAVYFSDIRDSDSIVYEIAKGKETVQEYTIVEGDTIWSISRAHDMDMDTLSALNSDLEDLDKLKLGQKLKLSYPKSLLSVSTTEVLKYEEAIPFKTETRDDDSMYKGETKVIQNGKDGLKAVEARIQKINGIEQNREVLSENVLEESTVKIVKTGTKVKAAMSSRGSGALLLPARGIVSSSFGKRWGRNHNGLDIANSTGTPVYAAESGKVIFSNKNGSFGNLIKVDHGGGLVTFYAHLNKRVVSSGERVERGQLIGYMGNTGRSTGSHLHFEVRVNGAPQNPSRYLP